MKTIAMSVKQKWDLFPIKQSLTEKEAMLIFRALFADACTEQTLEAFIKNFAILSDGIGIKSISSDGKNHYTQKMQIQTEPRT